MESEVRKTTKKQSPPTSPSSSVIPLPAPKRIKKLDSVVVNRIAAGEVIHRPSHALKELLENAIDAGATSIQISVKEGGLKSLVIQDNGCGIELEDFPIVCERFTTSKLASFEDLNSIATYGFRGEALASISHVAHLSITSRTQDAACAYKATYSDGKLVPDRPGASLVCACAGNVGTTITVQDLFYNVKSRLNALHKSKEHAHILEVVSRYAIHNAGIAISLRKIAGNQIEIHTQSQATAMDNIRTIFGANVARELLEVNTSEDDLRFSCFFTNPNFSSKKFNFLLFINNRLVESTALKKALDSVFNPLLPKGMHPFIYLSIHLPPDKVDVNVHPTKKEVIMLNEEKIVERVTHFVQESLTQANHSRHYQVHSLLPTSFTENPPVAPSKTWTPRPDFMVRTDARASTLDTWLFKVRQPIQATIDVAWRDLGLTSIQELQDQALSECDEDLHAILHDHSFVGFAKGPYALMQSGTYLYLVNTVDLCLDFFYLRSLALFSNYPKITLKEPVLIEEQALKVLSQQTHVLESLSITAENAAKKIVAHLLCHADLLEDYFSIGIHPPGTLTTLPCVLEGYLPAAPNLSVFLVRLCTEVNWEDEKSCLDGILREMALLFAPTMDDTHLVEHVIYPALREFYPNRMSRKFLTEIANLHELYKVFERC